MSKRYNKPGKKANKHGLTDTRLLKILSADNCKGKEKCDFCGKVIYKSMMEAHSASIAYNAAFLLTGPAKKVPYECHDAPGRFHFGSAVPKGMLSEPAVATPSEQFKPPQMPKVSQPIIQQKECKIIQPAPSNMDEITLNGCVYIKKHLIPKPPIIIGTVCMNGVTYNVVK